MSIGSFIFMKDSFGARLKFFRSKAGFSQQQLADKTGLSRKIISDYEVKLDVMPREGNLYKIADALGINSSNLVPKSNLEEGEKQPDGTIEIKMNLHELSREVVEAIKESASKNNRSIQDEFNIIASQAIKNAFERSEKEDDEEFFKFDNNPEQTNESAFDDYLKNH